MNFVFFLFLISIAMKIFVEIDADGSGWILTLDVEPSDTIEKVKAIIAAKKQVAIDEQCLIFAKTLLENERTLLHYDIHEESTLVWLQKIADVRIFIKCSNGSIRSFKIPKDYIIKQVISKFMEFETDESPRIIFFNRRLLEKGRSLLYYGIQNGATLHISSEVSVAL